MKITAKATKEQLKGFINDNIKAVKAKDKDLYDRIKYAGDMAKKDDSKVTKKDLMDLAKEMLKLLGDKCSVASLEVGEPVAPVAENSVKKLSKGKKKADEKVEEKAEEKVPEKPESEKEEEKVDTKKSAKKSSGNKKEQPKKDGVTDLEDVNNDKAVQMAKTFPKTITVGDDKYEMATDIKTIEDLHKAISDEQEIVFAFYWTKRHLRQFPYFNGYFGQPKSFDNDLDLATAIYVSDEMKVAYMISMYTEAYYMTLPEDFEEVDGVRFSNGIEFQIYRAV